MFVEASYQSDPRLVVAQPMPDFPFTPQGQSDWLAAQLGFASRHPALAGWFYFYPEFYPGIVPVCRIFAGKPVARASGAGAARRRDLRRPGPGRRDSGRG